jgi:penicillin-binding protein 1C
VARVFWFLDDSFLGSAPRGQALFWKPRPGEFTLRATDDRGRSTSLRFKVVLGND